MQCAPRYRGSEDWVRDGQVVRLAHVVKHIIHHVCDLFTIALRQLARMETGWGHAM